jgi:hypothetical protein
MHKQGVASGQHGIVEFPLTNKACPFDMPRAGSERSGMGQNEQLSLNHNFLHLPRHK